MNRDVAAFGWLKDRRLVLALALTTLAAFAFRIVGIRDQSLWFDEAYTALIVDLPLADAWRALVADGVHPPLYYLLMRAVRGVGIDEASLRIPSVLLGTLTVPLLYAICRPWLGRWGAVAASAFLALSPFHIWTSRDARMYALLGLLTVAGIGAHEAMMRGRSGRWAPAFCLTHAAAYLTHYFGLMLPLIEFVEILLRFPDRGRHLRRWTGLQVLSALPILGWVAVLAQRDEQIFGIGWVPPVSMVDLGKTFVNFSVGYREPLPVWGWLGVLLVGVLVVMGFRRPWRQPGVRSLVMVWAGLPIVACFLLSLRRPVYMDRFLIGSLPAWAIGAAAGLASFSPRVRLALATTGAVILAAGAAALCFGHGQTKEQWREASAVLSQAPADQVIVVRTLQMIVPFRHYGLGAARMEVLESNRAVAALADLTAGAEQVWLAYWNASADAHLVAASPPFDPTRETDPAAAAWVAGRGPRLNRRIDLVGITLMQFEIGQ